MLVVVGALVPGDRLELTPSISLPCSAWAVLMHPGSTNSSGVVRVAAAALDALMRRQHPFDVEAAKAAFDAAVAAFDAAVAADQAAAAAAGAEEDLPKAKKRKFEPPARRQILAGGGSLAAMGPDLSVYRIHLQQVCSISFAFQFMFHVPQVCR